MQFHLNSSILITSTHTGMCSVGAEVWADADIAQHLPAAQWGARVESVGQVFGQNVLEWLRS